MKNIHVLPTPNPSRLYEFGNQFNIQDKEQENFRSFNIHITNNEEIKRYGEYYLDIDTNEVKTSFENMGKYLSNEKKIILTTDKELIKDGVKSINDEFLEWFVKNPSCEFVEWDRNYNRGNGKYYYKIIIPKEETKQEEWISPMSSFKLREESKQTDWEFEISSGYNGYRNKITSDWIYESEYLKIFNGSKQETPNELDSVLAKITHQNDLGLSQWYEVVYYADDKWCSYSGSKTFEDGERVIEWKYCKELF